MPASTTLIAIIIIVDLSGVFRLNKACAPANPKKKYFKCRVITYQICLLNIDIIIKSTMVNPIGIHNGAVTHHQDQSICSVNFRTKNTMKSTPPKLTPPPLTLLLISIHH